MTKITLLRDDCGNAPKKAFIQELNVAFAKADVDTLLDKVTDDITWEIIGDKKIEGIDDFKQELHAMRDHKAAELVLERVLTHGTDGAASGVIVTGDRSEERRVGKE